MTMIIVSAMSGKMTAKTIVLTSAKKEEKRK